MKKINTLIKNLEAKRHPEYGLTRIQGCKLSSSDVDTALLYLKEMLKEGGRFPSTLMPIYNSEVKKLFEKNDIPTC